MSAHDPALGRAVTATARHRSLSSSITASTANTGQLTAPRTTLLRSGSRVSSMQRREYSACKVTPARCIPLHPQHAQLRHGRQTLERAHYHGQLQRPASRAAARLCSTSLCDFGCPIVRTRRRIRADRQCSIRALVLRIHLSSAWQLAAYLHAHPRFRRIQRGLPVCLYSVRRKHHIHSKTCCPQPNPAVFGAKPFADITASSVCDKSSVHGHATGPAATVFVSSVLLSPTPDGPSLPRTLPAPRSQA